VEPDLIDAYIVALRERLGRRRDADDIVDEVADHMREHADRLVARGEAADAAQHGAIARFGDVRVVARALAATDAGALAVPTPGTRRAGSAGLAAAVAWCVAAVVGAAGGHTEVLVPWTHTRYGIWVCTLTLAFGLSTLTVLGLLVRIGRLRTASGAALLVVGMLATVAMYPFGWAISVVAAVFAVTVLAGFARSWQHPDLVRPLRLLAVWLLGAVAVLFDDVLAIGPVDTYGDYEIVWLLAFLVGALGSAVAVGLVGLRLRAEPPANLGENLDLSVTASA